MTHQQSGPDHGRTDGAWSRRRFLSTIGAGAAAASLPLAALTQAAPAKQPNVIFCLLDDVGLFDTTVYGGEYYETPNMERLAARGVTFTNAYAASPLCSPTRASILTGKYPGRLFITAPAGHLPPLDTPFLAAQGPPWQEVVIPRSKRFLPPEELTLPELFQEAGYRTAHIGKWHLGVQPKHWPEAQGFDVVFHGAPDPGPPSYFSPYRFPTGTVTDGPEGEYITDRVTDEALTFIEENREGPFLLHLWHYAVHAPYHGKEDLIEKYEGMTDPRGKQDCPTMGAMIESMDQSIGRVLDQLDALDIADDTIIILMSDNGGNMYDNVKGTTPTNNWPLRNGKGNLYEGGVREPCIIVWPGVAKSGTKNNELISSVDFYPTMLDMVGLVDKPGHMCDGESLAPLLKREGTLGNRPIFCHFPHFIPATGNLPGTWVRQGDWKLIRFYGQGPDRADKYELYNIADDIGETKDVSADHPDTVAAMSKLIARHLKDTGSIVPPLNPAFQAGAFNPMTDKPVQGWIPHGMGDFEAKDGLLQMESLGKDPFIQTNAVPKSTGPITFKVRMRSSSKGQAQAFWISTAWGRYHRSRSVFFDPAHDGKWHEYALDMDCKGALRGLRLDPSTTPGKIDIDWVEVCSPDGKSLKRWDF